MRYIHANTSYQQYKELLEQSRKMSEDPDFFVKEMFALESKIRELESEIESQKSSLQSEKDANKLIRQMAAVLIEKLGEN